MTQASMEAFLAIQPGLRKSQVMAFEAVRAQGTATMDEVERATGRDLHQRMSELRALGWLVETGERRGGQTVYRCGQGVPVALRRRGGVERAVGRVMESRMGQDGTIDAVIRFDDPAVAAAVARMDVRVVVQVVRR